MDKLASFQKLSDVEMQNIVGGSTKFKTPQDAINYYNEFERGAVSGFFGW